MARRKAQILWLRDPFGWTRAEPRRRPSAHAACMNPQAPHPVPPHERLAMRPSGGRGGCSVTAARRARISRGYLPPPERGGRLGKTKAGAGQAPSRSNSSAINIGARLNDKNSRYLPGRTGRSRPRQVARRAEHEDPRRGLVVRPGSCGSIAGRSARTYGMGVTKCVWCCRRMGRAGTSNRWRGLAVQSRALGAEVRVCAPPEFAELLARVGAPLVPIGAWP